jgi:hypothetical protein
MLFGIANEVKLEQTEMHYYLKKIENPPEKRDFLLEFTIH